MRTGRYTRFIVALLMLLMYGAGEAWAFSQSDVEIEVKPDANAGTVAKSVTEENDGSYTVTLTMTPAANYYIKASDIVVEKLVSMDHAGARNRRNMPGVADVIQGTIYVNVTVHNEETDEDETQEQEVNIINGGYTGYYRFSVPNDCDGVYVTATFTSTAIVEGEPIRITSSTSLENSPSMTGHYILVDDVPASVVANLGTGEFTGTFEGEAKADGTFPIITGLTKPLFATTNGSATIKNVMLTDVNITTTSYSGTNVGALVGEAKGNTRIYNCGIIPEDQSKITRHYDEEENEVVIDGFTGNEIGGGSSSNVGSLVGKLTSDTNQSPRVINCFSYATLTGGGTLGGIVGNIGYNANESINQGNVANKAMVMNCMFYGDKSPSCPAISPVYGGANGAMIKNEGNTGVNPYNYFRKNASFDDAYTTIDQYKRSWPAEEKNLTRFEYYRSILNSNKNLCTYWVTNHAFSDQTDDDHAQIAKWVLDPSIAPYPILKKWDKYPSVINHDEERVWNTGVTKTESGHTLSAPQWVNRSSAAPYQGKKLGTLSVTINPGDHAASHVTTKYDDFVITDIDTLNHDYGYYKIQLPYYNEVFGNPAGTTWDRKYGGNYKDYVVTGWEITVSGGSNSFSNYNFADRNCTEKDDYSTSGRVFAQGGYYYVPEGVSSISIKAHWGKAVYLTNRNYSVDNVRVTAGYYTDNTNNPNDKGKTFTPAGTIESLFEGSEGSYTFHGGKVYNTLQGAIGGLDALSSNSDVYNQAIVLIGNHQAKNGNNSIAGSAGNYRPFTFMSADFDLDNEPDYCLQFQFRMNNDRPGIQPIRFDFLPVVELGLAVRHNNLAYAIGIFIPQGHFEITETSFMHTTQFEWDSKNITRIETNSPVILNGGEFEQITVRYANGNRTNYFLLGGNLWFHRFAPGVHPNLNNNNPTIKLCPVNVIGGDFPEFYLSGLYRPDKAPYSGQGNPYCYTNGGHFGIMAGSGYEEIKGDVTFKIDHSVIGEFYGGGINGAKPIGGNIDVTIDHSHVEFYCGGPKVGSMEYKDNGTTKYKTVKTQATGTTFGVFYGGGNGGNSYYRQLQRDGDFASSHISEWTTVTDNGNLYNFNLFNPLNINTTTDRPAVFDDGEGNDTTDPNKERREDKGYHAEYEYEVFNQSNGVADQITQRGFIKWIQFGTTKTGTITNTLNNCIINTNFYGGGNRGSVEGDVTSTLTNCEVQGSVYGAGYSASIPTFNIHDRTKVGTTDYPYPSIDPSGTLNKGKIGYYKDANDTSTDEFTKYKWTNDYPKKANGDEYDINKEEDATYMKEHPTFKGDDGQFYCYTWESLTGLGEVHGDTKLEIKGNTYIEGKIFNADGTVAKNDDNTDKQTGGAFGGGDASAVSGKATVTIETPSQKDGKTYNVYNVFGGGNSADIGQETKVELKNGIIGNNVYGGGNLGDVGTHTQIPNDNIGNYNWKNKNDQPNATGTNNITGTNNNTGVCTVEITNGTITGDVFGAGKGAGDTFWCEKGMVYSTNVSISAGTVNGDVYGGGEVGRVEDDTKVTIGVDGATGTTNAPIIHGNVFGAGKGLVTHGYSALVRGNPVVTIQGKAKVEENVYGGGEIASVGKHKVKIANGTPPDAPEDLPVGMPYTLADTNLGICTVTVKDHAEIIGSVFGAGQGVEDYSYDSSNKPQRMGMNGWEPLNSNDDYLVFLQTLALSTDTHVTIEGNANVGSSVYGGSENGFVQYDTNVLIKGSCGIGDNVFGGGCGLTGNAIAGRVNGNTNINILGGTITNDVYGGGALAKSNTKYTSTTSGTTTTVTYPTATVNLLGGAIGGEAYGGGLGNGSTAADVGNTKLNLNGIEKSYYDAADATMQTLYDELITKSADSDGYPVNRTGVKGATVSRIFGANNTNGSPQGSVTVHVFGTQNVDKNDITTKVSCPVQGTNETAKDYLGTLLTAATKSTSETTTTWLTGTDATVLNAAKTTYYNNEATAEQINTAIANVKAQLNSLYDMSAVYGGGDNANYTPDANIADASKTTNVIIEGCDYTSIKDVYGGGNAAAVPATDVLILGTKIIDQVFGGGNGEAGADYAAHVGFYRTTSGKENYTVGTGATYVKLVAGTIHDVYGGSNSNGDIRGGSNISMPSKDNYTAYDCCDDLKTQNVYGGGKNANMSSGTNIVLGCMPDDWIEEIYAGSREADVAGDVGLTITSGKFERVFGGNKTSGKIKGSITVNIEETTSCATPIVIGELYGGGYQAKYSVYGYNDNGTPRTKAEYEALRSQIAGKTDAQIEANDDLKAIADLLSGLPYDQPQLNVRSFTSIGAIYGGGFEADMVADPTVSINVVMGSRADDATLHTGTDDTYPVLGASETIPTTPSGLPYPVHTKGNIGVIGNVFGGGNLAIVDGSATVNIGTESRVELTSVEDNTSTTTIDEKRPTVLGANITGNVYGGGKLANITGNTEVNICAKEVTEGENKVWQSVTPGTAGVTISGNVYGGGKGVARETGDRAFFCEEAMVGVDGTNSANNNNSSTYANYGTHVRIGNGTVGTLENDGTLKAETGNVYGGGEIGRVEFHTNVTIGFGGGTGSTTKSPVIYGNVFGAGKGANTHGYSGLVRGDSKVTIQGDAKIGQSVYGGGEMASVGKYKVVDNLPTTPEWGGKCTVIIQGYAEIGPNDMKMVTTSGKPDDTGHVFGAGKGVLPYEGYTASQTPWSMQTTGKINYPATDEANYLKFIRSLGLASNTDVTIGGNAFVKGSVYGGSENGYVQANTHVTIAGGQVGNGFDIATNQGVNRPYTVTEWTNESTSVLKECAHWPFGVGESHAAPYNPYDIYDYQTGTTKPKPATDGHTFYGNVFGGGRGYYPYKEGTALTTEQEELGYSKGVWLRAAGSVGGNTVVDITGGHILTSVYGGNEQTDVTGSCTINMKGGTVGVPRTKEQIQAHPVTCNVFGAGKGDQRINFNTWTNVASTQVNISGDARIYGSTFGGGEDGHVLGDAETNIGGTVTIGTQDYNYSNVIIGSTGTSGSDGNVFGGGRGFSETALTAGVVGGDVRLNIHNGKILGTVFGGGRLASVGTFFAAAENSNYGQMQEDVTTPAVNYTQEECNEYNTANNLQEGDEGYRTTEDVKTPASTSSHGHIAITIDGGTIGATASDGKLATSSYTIGDVFGGSKGSTNNNLDYGLVKTTTIAMSGGKVNGSIYGGGEVAVVEGNTIINISGGEVGDGVTAKGGAKIGNVYGGGKGNIVEPDAGLIKGNTKVEITGSTTSPKIYHNIYGGGAYGSVGTITRATAGATYVPGTTSNVTNMPTAWERETEGTTNKNTGTAEVYVKGGRIGTDGNENGMVFGSSRGDVDTPVAPSEGAEPVDPNDHLAWVHNTKVEIGVSGSNNGPDVRGSVYGSGENGHVFADTQVNIHSGKVGIDAETTDYGTQSITNTSDGKTYIGANYPKRGNVYGGGCGEDNYPGTTNFNPLAGIVLGNTNVTIDGGKVVHNVYGAGALGSVGSAKLTTGGMTTILISGGQVGDDGVDDGNVYGAARGKLGLTQANIAQVRETSVTISSTGDVKGSVYGGGEAGIVKESVAVSMTGGTVGHDVYGGGALANTQISNWDASNNTWANGKYNTTTGKTTYSTTVSLTGGTITGDAYGGGLGRKAVTEVEGVKYTQEQANAYNTEHNLTSGDEGFKTTDDWKIEPVANVTEVEAYVYGDVLVELNNNNNGGPADDSKTGCAVSRVFGCNNLNGTPKGHVTVHVYATQSKVANTKIKDKQGKHTGMETGTTSTYDVAAVYGGGNLAPYIPADALLENNATNKARVEAACTEVIIEGCSLTSIKQVYGGGNAASVPASHVTVNSVYEIEEVFGGGNGADNYSLKEGNSDVWYQNPGANVGYYNYTHTVTSGSSPGTEANPYYTTVNNDNASDKKARQDNYRYGSGIAKTDIRGGEIHVVYGGSNKKGNISTTALSVYDGSDVSCPMKVGQTYGGGKDAPIDGEVKVELACATGIEEIFGGAMNADVDADINLRVTNGSHLKRVFGGNNTSGAINGSITVTIEEGGCEPIIIEDGLYAGGYLAPYSIYGYKKTGDTYDTESVAYIDENNETKYLDQRIPLTAADVAEVENFEPKADPRINIISATHIENVFGGGYQAKLVGNPHVNINMKQGKVEVTKKEKTDSDDATYAFTEGEGDEQKTYVYKDVAGNPYKKDDVTSETTGEDESAITKYYAALPVGTIGNVYGGGNMADIVGDTYVEIGTGTWVTSWDDEGKAVYTEISPARNAAKITGNVYGGGKGVTDHFECKKAMVGVDNESEDPNKRNGGTNVIIANGTVGTLDTNGKLVAGTGNVYGGGEIGRVEKNTVVTIGLGDGVKDGTKAPVIYGNVFGAGSGKNTHGYSALVRGNSTVTVQGNAWVQKSVYGGGETATVGKYALNDAGLPTAPARGGLCTVTIQGWAEIGPDNMQMTADDGPDKTGHVFGACKGVLPYEGYGDAQQPYHLDGDRQQDGTWVDHPREYTAFNNLTVDENKKLVVDNAYMTFINTLALATTTEVTIKDHAFVKGSVYGGSENGHVQGNTHVTIEGDCQIGNGDGVNRRYTEAEWTYDGSSEAKSLKECASWPYGKKIGTDADGKDLMEYLPYDVYKDSDNDGTPDYASDGHTFYGNVFGGGSGYFPYHKNKPAVLAALLEKDPGYADGLWHREAGSVGGNTRVEIKGGHILTSVYGGNECTDVTGTTTVEMSGGTVGVPRTMDQINAHPVTCYLFGAGKGDQRINFNTWTNVKETNVTITGGRIYGSVLGGGEDGHVLEDVTMTISETVGKTTKIGTTGATYFDGNVFGGGRGFGGDAQTAGTVGGNVGLTIEGGAILGNVYGGGRLASVGTLFTQPEAPNYGNFKEDVAAQATTYYEEGDDIPDGKSVGDVKTEAVAAERYGHITINISGGTIGNDEPNAQYSGNVFGGSMGRLDLLDGKRNSIWPKMAQVKNTSVNIYGDAVIKKNVYGGGELGTVRDNASVTIGGYLTVSGKDSTITASGSPTVNWDVYGGGYGSQDTQATTIKVKEETQAGSGQYNDVYYKFTPMQFAGCVGQNTFVNIKGGQVRKSVYGGGEMASVGIIDLRVDKDTNEYLYLKKNDAFTLSWPYEFTNVPGYFGATHVNITGGRLGITGKDYMGSGFKEDGVTPLTDEEKKALREDNGDVFGAGKGIAGNYEDYIFCANIGSSEVTITYENTSNPTSYKKDGSACITGSVYAGAENGHVMGDTKLTLNKGLVGHAIYGGGKGKGTFTKWLNKIEGVSNVVSESSSTGPETNGNMYKATIYSITAGKVFGNTNVTMNGGYVVRNIYGGGNMGSVGKGNYASGIDDYYPAGYGEALTDKLWDGVSTESKAFLNSGKSTVKIFGGNVGYIDYTKPEDYVKDGLPYGNIFGGCRGESAPNIGESPRYLYSPTFFSGYVNETDVIIGNADEDGPIIAGSVYGGGQDGHVRRDATVTINSGKIGSIYTGDGTNLNNAEWLYSGNVYGAGSGIGQYEYDFNYDGDYDDVVDYTNPQTGRTSTVKEKDFSTSAGSVTRFTTVTINGGTIHRNVYGGGSLSSVGAPKIPPTRTDEPLRRDNSDSGKETQGKQSENDVVIAGGQIGDDDSFAAGYGGYVFGASRGDATISNPASFAQAVWTDVDVQGGTILGDVYGGGEVGTVRQGTEVDMTGGIINHDVFGGGKGTTTVAANVGGDVLVTLNGTATTGEAGTITYNDNAVVKGSIFGANNINGTPKGHVTVHVYKTVPAGHEHEYDVTAVYGGGKQADYVPAETDTKQSTEVIIEGCDLTSIQEVYGGGYGAATPGTNVLIKGTKIINNVYGGGYGASTDTYTNPGANVGFLTGGTPYSSGDGKAIVQLMAGTINNVYGGSNTKGDIRGGSNVTSVTNDEYNANDPRCCKDLTVQEIYGGGKDAPMFGGTEIVLGCMPDSWIGEIYAGAENANVGNDVSLTLTSGKFGRVFGGNKSGGKLDGYIEVNIEENPDCDTPIIIGELYGGGNLAPYSIYGYDDENHGAVRTAPVDGKTPHNSPTVNVRAFTSIGAIYGGGYGERAVMVGNPTVNINEAVVSTSADDDYVGETKTLTDDDGKETKVILHPHKAGKMGVIGNVFGGGNAAKVIGSTNVNIGTTDQEPFVSLPLIPVVDEHGDPVYVTDQNNNPVYEVDENGQEVIETDTNGNPVYENDGVTPKKKRLQKKEVQKKDVVGADIRGNVYGGGNAAEVTGDTNVQIGKKKQ